VLQDKTNAARNWRGLSSRKQINKSKVGIVYMFMYEDVYEKKEPDNTKLHQKMRSIYVCTCMYSHCHHPVCVRLTFYLLIIFILGQDSQVVRRKLKRLRGV
jgi:hypothetical protein